MAATTSSMPAPILSIGTLAVSNSWGIQPWVAKRRASTTGGCSRASITLVPSLTRSVAGGRQRDTEIHEPSSKLGDVRDDYDGAQPARPPGEIARQCNG